MLSRGCMNCTVNNITRKSRIRREEKREKEKTTHKDQHASMRKALNIFINPPSLLKSIEAPIQNTQHFGLEFIPGFLDESGPFIDDINVSEVELLARSENLILELGNLGKIEPFEVIDKGEVTELLEKVRG